MVDIWDGEEDVISKILNNNNHHVSANDTNNYQTKSLHQEFMEIGENYQLPVIRKSSLEDVMQEFRQLNSVAEEKVNKDISCVYKEEARQQNVLKPPPGFQPKTNSNTLHIVPKRSVKPPPGFPVKSAPDVDMKRMVKPPPGLSLKNVNANTTDSASLSKSKVVRPPPGFPTTRNVDITKKDVQPNLQHQKPSSLVMIKHRYGNGMKDTCIEKPRQKLALMMEDFDSLSTIMDQELSSYEEKLVASNNQKGCDSLKEQGKVEMLKTLYYEQQEKTKVLEKQHEQIIIQTEVNHKNEMEDMKNYYENKLNKMAAQVSAAQKPDQNLKVEYNKAIQRREDEIENLNVMVSDLQNELDKHQTTSKPNKKLQFEFNRVLNEREEEIDRLNGVIHDMQCELERYEGGSDEIAMEVSFVVYLFMIGCLRYHLQL